MQKVAVLGLGIMGGSIVKALKKSKKYYVIGYNRSVEVSERALADGAIDEIWDGISPIDADVTIMAVNPNVTYNMLKTLPELLKKGSILTDICGVKAEVVKKGEAVCRENGVRFIGGHPMAGREVSGVQNSDDGIFREANYIVVPTDKNTFGAIELCKELGEILGFARISVLNPEKHDEMIAFLSQLTHCIAVSLMCANDNPGLVFYTGDSFRDLTRIANINDDMWSELFLSNREALLKEMEKYRTTFDKLYDCVKNNDREEMRSMMRISTERRGEFNKKKDK